MTKVGRPKSVEPRELVVSVRFTVVEYQHLLLLATRRGLSVGEYLRALGLAGLEKSAAKE